MRHRIVMHLRSGEKLEIIGPEWFTPEDGQAFGLGDLESEFTTVLAELGDRPYKIERRPIPGSEEEAV